MSLYEPECVVGSGLRRTLGRCEDTQRGLPLVEMAVRRSSVVNAVVLAAYSGYYWLQPRPIMGHPVLLVH